MLSVCLPPPQTSSLGNFSLRWLDWEIAASEKLKTVVFLTAGTFPPLQERGCSSLSYLWRNPCVTSSDLTRHQEPTEQRAFTFAPNTEKLPSENPAMRQINTETMISYSTLLSCLFKNPFQCLGLCRFAWCSPLFCEHRPFHLHFIQHYQTAEANLPFFLIRQFSSNDEHELFGVYTPMFVVHLSPTPCPVPPIPEIPRRSPTSADRGSHPLVFVCEESLLPFPTLGCRGHLALLWC